MNQLKFSILIPAYKKHYLKEAIESCLNQTYSNFEIIIVNDASPENLDEVVSDFSDERIKYYRNENNCGAIDVVDNWNKCLGYSTGDYVLCMGDDDRLLPDCLKEYFALISKYPGLGLYHGWTELIDQNSCFYDIQPPRPEYENVYSLIWNRWNNRALQFIGDFLFDADLLKKNNGFYSLPLAWGSDDISAVIAASKTGVANTQKIVFQYRVNPYTITNGGCYDIKVDAILKEREWFRSFLSSRLPKTEIENKYFCVIQRNLVRHFEKKVGLSMGLGLKKNLKWFITLFFIRKKYELSLNVFCYALLVGIKPKTLVSTKYGQV